jgi:hypothetical protein
MSLGLRRSIAGSLAAAMAIAGMAATTVPASAKNGRHAAAAAGIIGGLAAGALIGGMVAQPGPGPGYDDGPPGPDPGYGCGYSQQPVYDQWGRFAGYQPVPDC